MSTTDPAGVVLLAGAWGTEREPPARAGAETGWHLPQHVRDPALARRRLADQIRAGADAITAPTFRTSRQALARFGESRRAREWTAAAVTLAREAAHEAGREVLVCGSLSPLERGAAEELDLDQEAFAAHAGTLAESGVDVILVELMSGVASSLAATLSASATGLPVWSGAALETGEGLGEWAEALEPAEPQRLLLYAQAAEARVGLEELGRLTNRPLGACLTANAAPEDVTALLERGARVVGLASGASGEALGPLREAIDAFVATQSANAQGADAAWRAWLARAAAWAPGGPALWLGDEPAVELPAGFGWTVAPAGDAGRLPAGHYRLVVIEPSADWGSVGSGLLRLLDTGGILLGPVELGEAGQRGARILDRASDSDLSIVRRE